ncbi:hypothetical protein AV955_gp094 [Diadromus pulchellus ascovirus 4a]|uniref:Complete DpAV4 genome n=1 Tax=Diadromus pulchellus ascovirus 4a TaxID=158683 RepID=F2NZ23_9VIRU|nr:hypothetical protein AV955_gp094 [Diadromus pulchellus ascovirus 4a]CCA61451.1 unnamed protein product [Diadromus pulchellus ascovirus 4a]
MVIIRNKESVPYGILSNFYETELVLDGEKWNNVIDYVAFVKNKRYSVQDSGGLAKVWRNLIQDLTAKAVRLGIDAKANAQPAFARALLETGTKPIMYASNDPFLGINMASREGLNIYGKWLVNYRNILSSETPDVFYNAYVLSRFLNTAIYKEPLDRYLQLARQGATLRYLNDLLYRRYGNVVDIPSLETVENIRLSTRQQVSLKPEEIILRVRRDRIRNVKKENGAVLANQLFRTLVQEVMDANNISYSLDLFMRKIDKKTLNYLSDRVSRSYEVRLAEGKTPRFETDLYIPTDQEIRLAEEDSPIATFVNPDLEVVVDPDDSILSMKDDSTVFTVNGRDFPSINHLMVFVVGGLIDMDPYLMVFNPQNQLFYSGTDSLRFLNDNLDKYIEQTNKMRLLTALNAKIVTFPFIKDIVKTLDNAPLYVEDVESEITNGFYSELKDSTSWAEVFANRGSVSDYLASDAFFVFIQKEMMESFMNILVNVSEKRDLVTVKKVYEIFYGVNSFDKQRTGGVPMACIVKHSGLPETACAFLNERFVNRILAAEDVAKKAMKSDIVFGTKFVIMNTRTRMANGEFADPDYYNTANSKERLALAKVTSACLAVSGRKLVTADDILRAYNILVGEITRARIEEVGAATNTEKLTERVAAAVAGVVAVDEFVMEPVAEQPDEEDEGDENREIEGYDENDSFDYMDDDMYGAFDSADEQADTIMRQLSVKATTMRVFKEYVLKLAVGNYYRVNEFC